MFEAVTVAHALLDSGTTAAQEIDRVLAACLAFHQPVYLRLPSDMVDVPCPWPQPFAFPQPKGSDVGALKEAVAEATRRLGRAKRPLVVVGLDLGRLGLQDELLAFIETTGFPFVTQLLAKAVLSERHPQFLGIYEGNQSREAVLEQVALSDLVVQLGSGMSDTNTGGFTTRADPDSWILADLRSVKIGHHVYEDVNLLDFLRALTSNLGRGDPKSMELIPASESCRHRATRLYTPQPEAVLTVERLFDRMSHFLEPRTVVLAEMGVSLFCAAETLLPEGASFIGQTFYGSIGYTMGATLGVCLAAEDRPVVLFIGDGSFQVTGQDLSTLIRYGLRPVIVLLNNDGYTIERVICDGRYNDIQPWNYAALPEVFGGMPGTMVSTEEGLEAALTSKRSPGLFFLEARTGRWDCPDNLKILGRSMARNNHLEVAL
jgi:indolepyruvate decarboxylase